MKLKPGVTVLRVGDHSVQVGTDHGHQMVLRGLHDRQINALIACSHHSVSLDADQDDPLPSTLPIRLRMRLQHAGFLEDVTLPQHLALTFTVFDDVSVRVLDLVKNDFYLEVIPLQPRRVDDRLARVIGEGFLGLPLKRSLSNRYDLLPRYVPHSHGQSEALTIVSSQRFPAFEDSWMLVKEDIPHLLVTELEDGYDVGPLVIPGLSACGACLLSQENARDPDFLDHRKTAMRTPLVAPTPLAIHGAAWSIARFIQTFMGNDHLMTSGIHHIDARGGFSIRQAVPQANCGCKESSLSDRTSDR